MGMIDPSLIGLIGVTLGALASIGGIRMQASLNLRNLNVQLEHERKLSIDRLLSEKAEECFLSYDSWLQASQDEFASMLMLMKDSASHKSYTECVNRVKPGYKFDRLMMYPRLYFPSLLPQSELLEEVHRRRALIGAECLVNAVKGEKSSKELVPGFIGANQVLSTEGQKFLKSLQGFIKDRLSVV